MISDVGLVEHWAVRFDSGPYKGTHDYQTRESTARRTLVMAPGGILLHRYVSEWIEVDIPQGFADSQASVD